MACTMRRMIARVILWCIQEDDEARIQRVRQGLIEAMTAQLQQMTELHITMMETSHAQMQQQMEMQVARAIGEHYLQTIGQIEMLKEHLSKVNKDLHHYTTVRALTYAENLRASTAEFVEKLGGALR